MYAYICKKTDTYNTFCMSLKTNYWGGSNFEGADPSPQSF